MPALLRLTLFALLLGALPAATHAQAPPVWLTNACVVDVETGTATEGASVLVEYGKIARITTQAFMPMEGVREIDLGGACVLPGYIDAHVHIASIDAAERALASGVTTARSANTPAYEDVALQALVEARALAGPEILAAGTFVTPDLGERILADARLAPLHEGVTSEEALRQLVRINLDRGADVIKTRATERAGLPDTDPRKQVYTEEQLRIVVDEAAKGGAPVLVHAHGDEGAQAAVRAGARSIEHGTYLTEETLRLMREQGTFLVPTYTIVRDLMEPGGEYDNPVLRIRGAHMRPNLEHAIRTAHALGVPIVASTDSGYGPESLARVGTEIVHFAELGLSPAEALRTATTVAADLLGIADRTGRLAEGYEADLVVVAGNPLEQIDVVQDVVLVLSDGHVAVNRLPFGR